MLIEISDRELNMIVYGLSHARAKLSVLAHDPQLKTREKTIYLRKMNEVHAFSTQLVEGTRYREG